MPVEDYWSDPHRVGNAFREEGAVRVVVLPTGVRAHVITRYADVRAALSDPRLAKRAGLVRPVVEAQMVAAGHDAATASVLFSPHMLFADGEDHARLRRLVTSVLTRRRMAELAPRIEIVAAGLVGALADVSGPVDIIERLAFPLPLTVICDLLGIPEPDRAALRGWTGALMDEDPRNVIPASQGMARYVADLIADRRARPGDDLVSELVGAGDADDRLTPDELLGVVVLLIVAGHETTTNSLGNAIATLLVDRTRWRELVDHPDRIAAAVEEALRFEGGVRHATYRVTTEPVTYGGVTIPPGEIVLPSLASANRDPAAYLDPGAFLPTSRDTEPRHLGFGHGVHYCLGAPLARAQLTAALRLLTSSYPYARLANPYEPPTFSQSPIALARRDLRVLLRRFPPTRSARTWGVARR